jgi:hypothetical protein
LAGAIAAGCGARTGLSDGVDVAGVALDASTPVLDASAVVDAASVKDARADATAVRDAAPHDAAPHDAAPTCPGPVVVDPTDGSLGGGGCDLAFIIDRSSSMNTVRTASGRTRCADAVLYAARQFGAFRCGMHADTAGNCPTGTTLDPAVSVFFDDQMPPNPSEPYFGGCTTPKRVNVFTFNSLTGLRSETVGINSNPNGAADGWVNLADNCQADAALARIRSLASCQGLTPLADVLCQLPQLNLPAPPVTDYVAYHEWQHQAGKIKLITDGIENDSTGSCSGPTDDRAMDGGHTALDWSQDSWQWKTWEEVTLSLWSIDTTVFVPASPMPGIDTETGLNLPSTEVPNAELFLTDIHGMNPRRGNLTVVSDGM